MTDYFYRTVLAVLVLALAFDARAQTVLEPVVREDDGPSSLSE